MATTKAKTKSRAKKPSVSTAKSDAGKSVVAKSVVPVEQPKKQTLVAKIFGRKYDKNENILSIFKSPKIIGALLAELIGAMIIAIVLLTVGAFSGYFDALLVSIVVLGLSVALFAISGANINPLITIGLMVSRRISPIRGVLYIIAQIFGAWLGLLIVNAFAMYNPELGAKLPAMAELTMSTDGTPGTFWPLLFLELIGAAIIGFFFVRALAYKRSTFTFGVLVAAGFYIALTIGLYFTAGFMGAQDHTYIFNPAVAIMYQILPSTGADFGDLMCKIGLALSTYVLAPAIGAAIGAVLADTTTAVAETSETV